MCDCVCMTNCVTKNTSHNLVVMYKNTYLKLKDVDVDDLCKWVSQMREEFKGKGSHPTFGASLRVLAHACKTDACLTL